MAIKWVVARTQPRRERWAEKNIQRQGATPYTPRYAELGPSPTLRGRLVLRELPLFPSYIFVALPDERWRFLLGTFGLMGLITSGDKPIFVPEAIIAELRSREVEGVVHLPSLAPKKFSNGEKVRLSHGPFEGRVGIYQEHTAAQREHVLLEVLGRPTPVLIGEELLEVA